MRATAAVLAALLIGCSGGGQTSAEPTTTTTTSSEATPEEAFTQAASAAGFDEAAALDLMQLVCQDLTDLPAEVGENMGDLAAATVLASVVDSDLTDDDATFLLQLGAIHLCPEHVETIGDFLDDRGLR